MNSSTALSGISPRGRPGRALSRNELARAIMSTTALDQVEALSREICGFSEIDYERNKALWLKEQRPAKLDAEAVLRQLDQFEAEARRRGVTHTTFRRLTEVLNLDGSQRDDLRQFLINSRPTQYHPPLWSFATGLRSARGSTGT
jgi:hypothetical protein